MSSAASHLAGARAAGLQHFHDAERAWSEWLVLLLGTVNGGMLHWAEWMAEEEEQSRCGSDDVEEPQQPPLCSGGAALASSRRVSRAGIFAALDQPLLASSEAVNMPFLGNGSGHAAALR